MVLFSVAVATGEASWNITSFKTGVWLCCSAGGMWMGIVTAWWVAAVSQYSPYSCHLRAETVSWFPSSKWTQKSREIKGVSSKHTGKQKWLESQKQVLRNSRIHGILSHAMSRDLRQLWVCIVAFFSFWSYGQSPQMFLLLFGETNESRYFDISRQ